MQICWILILLSLSAAQAHVGTRVYPVYELPTVDLPDIHDGSLEDWEDALGVPTLTNADFTGHPLIGGDPTATDDLAWQVFLAWHHATGRIYVGMVRVDDVYLNAYDGSDVWSMWQYDATEFLVDGDHSGGMYQGPTVGRGDLLSQAQQYMMLPTSAAGRSMSLWEADSRPFPPSQTAWLTQPPFGDAGGRDFVGLPTESVLEFYITPFDELVPDVPDQSRPSRLASGNIIGLQLNVADFDVPGEPHSGFFALGGASDAWRDASQFVDAELVGCHVLDCSGARPSAVAADSWGRIKAGLQVASGENKLATRRQGDLR
jgi:hypothetical protein